MAKWIFKLSPRTTRETLEAKLEGFGTPIGWSPSGKLHLEVDEGDVRDLMSRWLHLHAYVE